MHKRKQRASLLSFVWMNVDEEGGFCSFISGAQQTRMYKRTQHARLSSGWMNVDEEGGFCSFISGAQQTRMYKRTQHARLSSGWMNRDEDELLFVGFECSTDNAQEKTTCKA
jgi:hypothetical protein